VTRFGSRFVALVLLLLPGAAEAQSPIATIRGRVTGPERGQLGGIEVILRNEETGVTVTSVTDADGRYARLGLDPGTWTVSARRIGYRGAPSLPLRLALGMTLDVDLALRETATRLEPLEVVAEERTAADLASRVGQEEIRRTPVSGRNFTDLLALIPAVQLGGSSSQGGNVTLPGGRRSGTVIQMDGSGATSTFFGGEPRGSDRVPIPFSIDVVRELVVSANPIDVASGGYTGGVVNAVTRSGTNRWTGSLYGYLRDGALAGTEFSGAPASDFSAKQIGGFLSGPLMRDRMHLLLSVERQVHAEPVPGLPAPGSEPDPASNIHPDSVARLLSILRSGYGVEESAGILPQAQNEWALFGRLDWQLTGRHHLTFRYNHTALLVTRDRVQPGDLSGNAGDFEARGGSGVLRLGSALGKRWFNEVVIQRATEGRPRTAYSLLPRARVEVSSDFGGGALGLLATRCCNDGLLPNDLSENSWEVTDNLHYRRGAHALKLGGSAGFHSYRDNFFSNQQGEFVFASLSALEQGRPTQFTRALPDPGPDGRYFTSDDVRPLAEFSMREAALYLQDVIEAGPDVRVTAGVRYGLTRFRGAPARNQMLVDTFGLRNDVVPRSTTLDARLGVVWDVRNDGSRLVRAGIGTYTGRFPVALHSTGLLGTGLNTRVLTCADSVTPAPDYRRYAADASTIPTTCAGGSQADIPVSSVSLMDSMFGLPRSLKGSMGYEHRLGNAVVAAVGMLYARTTGYYFAADKNLGPERFRSAVEDRPVYAPLDGIRTTGGLAGRVIPGANRATRSFGGGRRPWRDCAIM
jgi:hypothetical protein